MTWAEIAGVAVVVIVLAIFGLAAMSDVVIGEQHDSDDCGECDNE